MATPIDTEFSRSGPLEQRPTGTKRGRLFWATTRVDPFSGATVVWAALCYDVGSGWLQVTPSDWQLYKSSFPLLDGGVTGVTNVSYELTGTRATYQVMPSGSIDYSFTASHAHRHTAIRGLPHLGPSSRRNSHQPATELRRFDNDVAKCSVMTDSISVRAPTAT